MSALLKISGSVMAILGIVLGAMTFISPGKMDVYGIKLDTAAILLVGGIVALGISSLIDAVRDNVRRPIAETVGETRAVTVEPISPEPMNFGRKATEAAAATAAVAGGIGLAAQSRAATVPPVLPSSGDSVADTISALEKAKADVMRSMSGMDSLSHSPQQPPPARAAALSEPAPVHAVEHAPDTDEPVDAGSSDDDLFVIEEKVIRGRPARILSDETVEAETDEGWMRFENLEHLNEYLDSVDEQAT